jgi:hypothetical protein
LSNCKDAIAGALTVITPMMPKPRSPACLDLFFPFFVNNIPMRLFQCVRKIVSCLGIVRRPWSTVDTNNKITDALYLLIASIYLWRH